MGRWAKGLWRGLAGAVRQRLVEAGEVDLVEVLKAVGVLMVWVVVGVGMVGWVTVGVGMLGWELAMCLGSFQAPPMGNFLWQWGQDTGEAAGLFLPSVFLTFASAILFDFTFD